MLEDTTSLDGAQISNKTDRYNYKNLFLVTCMLKNFTFIYMQL